MTFAPRLFLKFSCINAQKILYLLFENVLYHLDKNSFSYIPWKALHFLLFWFLILFFFFTLYYLTKNTYKVHFILVGEWTNGILNLSKVYFCRNVYYKIKEVYLFLCEKNILKHCNPILKFPFSFPRELTVRVYT